MKAEDSPWGMVINYPNEDLIDILKQGPVGWLRTEVYYDRQPGPGQFTPDWSDILRKVRAAYHPPEQQVYFGINPNYPNWIASGKPQHPGGPASNDWNLRLQHWDAFVQQVVQAVGPLGVRYFNIGNEPNDKDKTFFIYGDEEYFNMLHVAAQRIHANGYKVCAPDIATADKHRPWDFLGRCISHLQHYNQTLDVVTIHGYVGKDELVAGFINYLYQTVGVLNSCGVNAPIWLTETGVSNQHYPGDPAKNAQRITELCEWIGEGPVPPSPKPRFNQKFLKKIFFYVWSDDAPMGGKYAWLDRSLKPLPYLWDTYKRVIQWK